MRVNTTLGFAASFTALVLLSMATVWASGGSTAPKTPSPAPARAAEQATEHYNSGLKIRDKAWRLEKQVAVASGNAERDKLALRIEKLYRKAMVEFTRATEKNPRFHQAYSSLGYASRKLAEYEASLAAYDRALALAPEYAEAIEYRGEAYLGLGRVDDAKQAYIRLFGLDRAKADELLGAMKAWVVERREDPGELSPPALDELGVWIEQREQIAGQSASLAGSDEGGW